MAYDITFVLNDKIGSKDWLASKYFHLMIVKDILYN